MPYPGSSLHRRGRRWPSQSRRQQRESLGRPPPSSCTPPIAFPPRAPCDERRSRRRAPLPRALLPFPRASPPPPHRFPRPPPPPGGAGGAWEGSCMSPAASSSLIASAPIFIASSSTRLIVASLCVLPAIFVVRSTTSRLSASAAGFTSSDAADASLAAVWTLG